MSDTITTHRVHPGHGRGKKRRKIFSLSCFVLWVLLPVKPFGRRSSYIGDQGSHSALAKVLPVSFKIWIVFGVWVVIDRESETGKINQEREGGIERGKSIENHRLWGWWRISMRAESIAFCHGLHSSARARERERECSRSKNIGPVLYTFKPKQPSPNRHDPITQPITLKPRLKFNPTQAKPTTKIYQQPNPKIILLYKILKPKIRIS